MIEVLIYLLIFAAVILDIVALMWILFDDLIYDGYEKLQL